MQNTKYLLDPERKLQLMRLVVDAYARQQEEQSEAYAEPVIDKPASKRGLLATARQGTPLTEEQKKARKSIRDLITGVRNK